LRIAFGGHDGLRAQIHAIMVFATAGLALLASPRRWRGQLARSAGLFGVLVFVVVALSSCATLNENQCENANWRNLGLSDGLRGYAAGHIAEHEKACARFGLPVEPLAWQSGWQEGIARYCEPLNGLSVGRQGQTYRSSCPTEMAPAFLAAYEIGRSVYRARSDRDSVSNNIARLSEQIAAASDDAERASLRRQLDVLLIELGSANVRLQVAESAADDYQFQLSRRQ